MVEIFRFQVLQIDIASLEGVFPFLQSLHLHTDTFQQLDQLDHVQYLRYIANHHFFFRQQAGTYHLQRFILRSLRDQFAL